MSRKPALICLVATLCLAACSSSKSSTVPQDESRTVAEAAAGSQGEPDTNAPSEPEANPQKTHEDDWVDYNRATPGGGYVEAEPGDTGKVEISVLDKPTGQVSCDWLEEADGVGEHMTYETEQDGKPAKVQFADYEANLPFPRKGSAFRFRDASGEYFLYRCEGVSAMSDECDGAIAQGVTLEKVTDTGTQTVWRSDALLGSGNEACNLPGDSFTDLAPGDFDGDGRVEVLYSSASFEPARQRVTIRQADGARYVAEVDVSKGLEADGEQVTNDDILRAFGDALCPASEASITLIAIDPAGNEKARGPSSSKAVQDAVPQPIRRALSDVLVSGKECPK